MRGAVTRLATLATTLVVPAFAGATLSPMPLRAQISRADSAAVLYETARTLYDEGRRDLAEDLLELVMSRYPGTPAARAAQELFRELSRIRGTGGGRTELIVWNTLFGAWLGVAVPAALGADEPEPYGLGLLLGGPAGLLSASAYSRSNPLGTGRARAMVFGSQWGTFQGIGWREALDLGQRTVTEQVCVEYDMSGSCTRTETYEYGEGSDRAPFTAAVVGGLGGLLTGAVVARSTEISGGDATLASHAAWWGTWYGLAAAVVTNADGDAVWTVVLLGGNVGLLAGLLGTPHVEPTSGQVWLSSAAGLAGLVVGFGIDLIADLFDDGEEELAMIIPSVTAGIGLAAAAAGWREERRQNPSAGTGFGDALLNVADGFSFGPPTPTPVALPVFEPTGRWRWTPGVLIPLLDARF